MKLRTPSSGTAVVSDRHAWQNFGFAGLMLAAALLSRWWLDQYLRDAIPLAMMYVAIAFAVWFGGWKPAASIAVAGYFLSLYFFVTPRFSFKLASEIGPMRGIMYAVTSVIIIFLCESIRGARQRHAVSEAKVVSILENMRECFCAVDETWRIVSVNRAAEQSLKKSRDQLRSETLWQAASALVGTPAEADLRRALRDRVSVEFETNAITPGCWHAVSAIPADRELSIFFQDITAKRAHVDQLERLVDDRTAALQRIIGDLETFSYTLVHDMRAPLRSISGFAEMLALEHAPQLNADGKRHLARIQKAASRMDQLITDILNYSQLSQGQPELRPMNLEDIFRDLLRSLPELHADKADVLIDAPLPTVRGNSTLLTQCFSNLLLNAAKFVAPGVKPRIRIQARINGGMARVEIADNGIGVAPEATARIFEPFRREHANYDGTGIGLAIVRKVAEQIGGRVGVESEPGQGSRFWVELPVVSPSSPALENHSSARVLV